MEKEDLKITIDGNVLYLSGEKRIERESHDSSYHIMEHAYGAFQRAIPLPRNVRTDDTDASYKNGVLKIHLPKASSEKVKNIPLP